MAAPHVGRPGGPARRSNLADRIYARIKAELFDFELMPGDALSENEIAARTGASRTPVREALFRLQRDGYVDVREHSGWYVRPLDFDVFDELYDVRITLECAAVARLCALDHRPPELAELIAIWQIERSERETDSTTLWQLDEQFHAGLLAAAGNREMARIHRDVTERIRIVRRLDFVQPARVEATYEEHAEILNRLAEGHAAAAQKALERHIRASRDAVRQITLHGLFEARDALRTRER
ncbi:GntR family transcriptional regulator [Salinisphaera sp.]|uniref:GntR family transcriptional regulator n=1 Tax=Salinisphaera sp. TaxID=1914330 RepID=UPI000C35445F|nr:GntR family transcriptional regulator [Salinisphaera sp.]MBS64378.1 GntR family transcriptional regulator [Salinisphaera sp.]